MSTSRTYIVEETVTVRSIVDAESIGAAGKAHCALFPIPHDAYRDALDGRVVLVDQEVQIRAQEDVE